MLLRAARRFGYPSVSRMCAELTSSEISELIAFEWLEPDIGLRIDRGFAAVMSLIYGRTRGKKEDKKYLQDFMPKWGPVDHEAVGNKARHIGQLWREQAAIEEQIEQVKRNG